VLDQRVARRRAINALYRRLLGGVPGLAFMPEAEYGVSNGWLTVVTLDDRQFGVGPEEVRLRLEQRDIESRRVWKPLHLQPVFAGCSLRGGAVASDLFERGLCLPSGSSMSDADVTRVAAELVACSPALVRRRPAARPASPSEPSVAADAAPSLGK